MTEKRWTKQKIDQLIDLYDTHGFTFQEIGDQYGISRQRVEQLIGGKVDSARIPKIGTAREESFIKSLGTDTDINIAKRFGISKSTVGYYRRVYGIKRYTAPPGCSKCATNPYSRGYCKACYMRWMRNWRT